MTDRDRAREDLLGALISSKATAARVRATLDSSQFADHAPLAMLVADHDLRHPDAPPDGPGRRHSLLAHIESLVEAGRRHEARSGVHRGRAEDPRWALAVVAHADLQTQVARASTTQEIHELLAAFGERRGDGVAPAVPGPATRHRLRRRAADWPGLPERSS